MKEKSGYFADNKKLDSRTQEILDRRRKKEQEQRLDQLKEGKIVHFPFGIGLPEESKCPFVPNTGCGLIKEKKRYLLDNGQVLVIASSCQHCQVHESYRSALDSRVVTRWIATGGPPRTLALRPC